MSSRRCSHNRRGYQKDGNDSGCQEEEEGGNGASYCGTRGWWRAEPQETKDGVMAVNMWK